LPRIFDTPIITNDQSIDRVISAGLPVALIFFDGKIPEDSKQLIEHLARKHAGELLIAQINKKDNPASTRRFSVGREPVLVTILNSQTLTKAEEASTNDIEKHVMFLLGKGPKPLDNQRPTQGDSSSEKVQTRSTHPQTVSDSTFEQEVLQAKQVVLVDFWAPWCGPCRMTEPILEKLVEELTGKVLVAKVNVDQNPILSEKYGIQSIPTMMIVKNGRIVDRWAGALPEAAIRGRLSVHTN
jgi:thioredoxin 1